MDPCPVTHRQFAAFVAATGYRTVAGRVPNPGDYPGALPHMLKPAIMDLTAQNDSPLTIAPTGRRMKFLRLPGRISAGFWGRRFHFGATTT
jgi:hypothetical protein